MRTALFIALSICLGAVIGIGSAWANLGGVVALRRWMADGDTRIAKLGEGCEAPPNGPQPKAVFDSEDFNFGIVESGTKARHVFEVTNQGGYPLCLENGGTSCGQCTVSEISRRTVPPGEKAEVVIEYHSTSNERHFRQHAIIITNDTARPEVMLSVSGQLAASLRVLPTDLVITRIFSNESQAAEVRLFAYGTNKLEVTNTTFTQAETAALFDAKTEPLSNEEVKAAGAKSGVLVKVTIKPGLPLGLVQQTIRLETNLPEKSEVTVPILGIVESNILVVGAGWNPRGGVLELGVIKRSEGLRRKLQLAVRGPRPPDLKVIIGSKDPPWLKASIGQVREENANLATVPFEIEVPRMSPPTNRLGSVQGKSAYVILKTNSPGSEEVRIRVRFAVED